MSGEFMLENLPVTPATFTLNGVVCRYFIQCVDDVEISFCNN